MFQTLLNILTNPIMIPILIGLAGALHRGWSKFQEQRTKSLALQERRRAERDALRTGRGPVTREPAAAQPSASSAADERRARIEALRQKRIEQLRKLREQRGSVGASPRADAPPSGSTPPSRTRAPGATRQPRAPGVATGSASRSGGPRSGPAPGVQRQPPAPTRPAQAAPQPTRRRRQPEAKSSQRVPDAIQPNEIGSDPAYEIGGEGRILSRRRSGTFGSRAALRRAIIAREVLGPPVALRRGSEHEG